MIVVIALMSLVVIAFMSLIPAVVFMIPVAFMQLPALLVMVVVRMVPGSSLIWRTVPSSSHPAIVTTVRRPVPVNPGVSRTWHRTALLMTQRRRRAADIDSDLSRSSDGENHCEKYSTYPISISFFASPCKHLSTDSLGNAYV